MEIHTAIKLTKYAITASMAITGVQMRGQENAALLLGALSQLLQSLEAERHALHRMRLGGNVLIISLSAILQPVRLPNV
jgi:hypothetical protein